jgi:predicted ATPase
LANTGNEPGLDSAAVYAEVANRLSQLIDDVRSISVDRDERRQLLTIYVKGRDGTAYPARALSDGTLRFLALTVLSIEPDSEGYYAWRSPKTAFTRNEYPL